MWRWWLTLQLLLIVGWGALRLARQLRLRAELRVGLGRAFVAVALASPLLVLLAGAGVTPVPLRPAAQVWGDPAAGLQIEWSGQPQAGLVKLPAAPTAEGWGSGLPPLPLLFLALGLAGWLRRQRGLQRARDRAPLRRVHRSPREPRRGHPGLLPRGPSPGLELRGHSPGLGPAWTALVWTRHGLQPMVALDPALPADQARIALRHELVHLRHGDPRSALFASLAQALAWPLPAAAWLAAELCQAEELRCDQALLARGTSPRRYGRTLLALAGPSPRTAHAAAHGHLMERIDMLSRIRPPSPRLLRTTLLAAFLGTAFAVHASQQLVVERQIDRATFSALVDETDSAVFPVPDEPTIHAQLNEWLASRNGRGWLRKSIERRPDWQRLVDGALEDAGFPPELAAVPLLESGYTNLGADPAKEVGPHIPGRGLWMFIPETARRYGMQVDAQRDERLDPERETEAAIALLGDLYREFGDWHLALAGYNQGASHVRAAIERHGTRDAWELVEIGALNAYLPKLMTCLLVLENPELVEDA